MKALPSLFFARASSLLSLYGRSAAILVCARTSPARRLRSLARSKLRHLSTCSALARVVVAAGRMEDGHDVRISGSGVECCQRRHFFEFSRHTAQIFWSAVWSPDGTMIASGDESAKALVWNGNSGKLLFALRGHSLSICSIAWSPDGTKIVTASRDTYVRMWSSSSGAMLLALSGHSNTVVFSWWHGLRVAA